MDIMASTHDEAACEYANRGDWGACTLPVVVAGPFGSKADAENANPWEGRMVEVEIE